MGDPGGWQDVKDVLRAACGQLQSGQMLHTPSFSLYEAMSAMELGNEKMDAAGAGCRSAGQLIADGAAPECMSVDQALGVMEQLLVLEATWHSGAALAQTVFTSLYMLQPDRLKDSSPLVWAFCKGLTATCVAVRWLVMTGAVAEEEDFNCWVLGLPMQDTPVPLPDADCLPLLEEAEQRAHDLASKACGLDGGRSGAAMYMLIASHLAFRRELHTALLGLCCKSQEGVAGASDALTAAKAHLKRMTEQSPALRRLKAAASAAPKGAAASDGSMQREPVQECVELPVPGFVGSVNKHLLGPAPPRAVQIMEPKPTFDYFAHLLDHLQEATKVLEVKSYRGLVHHVERLSRARAGTVARSAAHYLIAGNAWGAPMVSASASLAGLASQLFPRADGAAPAASTSAAPNGTPSTTAATATTTTTTTTTTTEHATTTGTASTSQAAPTAPPLPVWVLDRHLVCEACALPEAAGAVGPDVDMFTEQVVIAAGNWAQAMLLNSSRQRRRLRRNLDDWANMYQHALNADLSEPFAAFTQRAQWVWAPPKDEDTPMDYFPGPLSTWVERETALSEALHLLLGFELQLYGPAEYAMVYWYASVLLGVAKSTAQVLHGYRAPAGGAARPSLALPAKPSGKKKGRGGRSAAEQPAPPAPTDAATARRQACFIVDALRAELLGSMCLGMVRLMLALKVAGIVPDPILAFNSVREWFDQRFSAFHTPPLARPEPMGYDQYLEGVGAADQMSAGQLLALAAESFATVRHAHTRLLAHLAAPQHQMASTVPPHHLEEHAALDRVAAADIVAAAILADMLRGPAGQEEQGPQRALPNVAFGWATHPYFPTIKITRKQQQQ